MDTSKVSRDMIADVWVRCHITLGRHTVANNL